MQFVIVLYYLTCLVFGPSNRGLCGQNSRRNLELVFGKGFEESRPAVPLSSPLPPSPTEFPIILGNPYDHAGKDGLDIVSADIRRDRGTGTAAVTDDYSLDESIREDWEIIRATEFVKSCGREICKLPGDAKKQFGERPANIDFLQEPYFCRCDEECASYGDCCKSIALRVVVDNPWRCHRLQHENQWVMMISTCPKNATGSESDMELCTSPEKVSDSGYKYDLDLPVYSNSSKRLYRNVYCARCNGVTNSNIFAMDMKILCSRNMTPIEWKSFISVAKYQRGERYWQDGGDYCGLYLSELDGTRIGALVPGVRFCGFNAINSCPPGSNRRDADLCVSYSQYVESRSKVTYKNWHCAKCNGVTDMAKNTKCFQFQHHPFPPEVERIKPAPGVVFGQGGIPLLFDFTLKFEESYVGVDIKCEEDQVWNFLTKKCHQAICPKNHVMEDGECLLIVPDKHDKDSENDNVTACFVIPVHQSHFERLPNGSLLVYKTQTATATAKDSNDTLIVAPGDFEVINETTMSICAKELHDGYSGKFSSVIHYLSLVFLVISVVFLSLHMILFIVIPKLQNLPGKNLFCLTLSLFVSQLLFITLLNNKSRFLCFGAAVAMHYFFLASFFWMNIMSFDIWRTFSNEFIVKRQSPNSQRTFIKYSLFAWMSAAVIVTAAVATDLGLMHITTEMEGYQLMQRIRPRYGDNHFCWINQGLPAFVFFAAPVALIIFVNFILYALTAKAIFLQHREASNVLEKEKVSKMASATSSASGRSIEQELRVKLYAMLALVMGLTWIFGFLSNMSVWLDIIFVSVNGLQGTFIFVAFDCKIKVWRLLRDQFNNSSTSNQLRQFLGTKTTTNTNTLSSSSGTGMKEPNNVPPPFDSRDDRVKI